MRPGAMAVFLHKILAKPVAARPSAHRFAQFEYLRRNGSNFMTAAQRVRLTKVEFLVHFASPRLRETKKILDMIVFSREGAKPQRCESLELRFR